VGAGHQAAAGGQEAGQVSCRKHQIFPGMTAAAAEALRQWVYVPYMYGNYIELHLI
jgi:hypothetical protein